MLICTQCFKRYDGRDAHFCDSSLDRIEKMWRTTHPSFVAWDDLVMTDHMKEKLYDKGLTIYYSGDGNEDPA